MVTIGAVTLFVFWELSSWAQEEEEAVHRRLLQRPVEVFWGPTEGDRRGRQALWDGAGPVAVWSGADGGRCGRPAAAGGGGGGEGVDWGGEGVALVGDSDGPEGWA